MNKKKIKVKNNIEIRRVYYSFILVILLQIALLILCTVSIYKHIIILYWISLILMIINIVPIIGGLNLMYINNKNNKK